MTPQEETAALLRHFTWDHLPPHLQAVSRPFADLARMLAATLPPDPELPVALRRLLEAKEAAVRSVAAPPIASAHTAAQTAQMPAPQRSLSDVLRAAAREELTGPRAPRHGR